LLRFGGRVPALLCCPRSFATQATCAVVCANHSHLRSFGPQKASAPVPPLIFVVAQLDRCTSCHACEDASDPPSKPRPTSALGRGAPWTLMDALGGRASLAALHPRLFYRWSAPTDAPALRWTGGRDCCFRELSCYEESPAARAFAADVEASVVMASLPQHAGTLLARPPPVAPAVHTPIVCGGPGSRPGSASVFSRLGAWRAREAQSVGRNNYCLRTLYRVGPAPSKPPCRLR